MPAQHVGDEPLPWARQMVGEVLDGRYRLLEVVGESGMGAVFRAEDQALERVVAVKVVSPWLKPQVAARFKTEAVRAARLGEHPCLVTVYDTGHDQAGRRYISMQYVEGRTLAAVLSDGPLPVAESARVVGDVLAGLAHVHAGGVFHRDVKPSNVMVTADGRVKVVDFGIARHVEDTVMTPTGGAMGTPPYVAPERVLNKPVDARADLYSTGCLLFEVLTGRPPFVGDGVAVAHAHVYDPPPRPSALRPGLPACVDSIVARALAKEPEDRYQTAGEFRQALGALAAPSPPSLLSDQPEPARGRRWRRGGVPEVGVLDVARAKRKDPGGAAGPVVRLGRLDGIVSYQARPPSPAADVAAVCRQIAGQAWSAASPRVRLSGIDWRVLDVALGKSRHRALLLSDRVIGGGLYNQEKVATTWERCDLRRWLNDDFAWSLGQPLTSRALQTEVRNGPNPTWGTDGGRDTVDRFFLLSMEEAAERLAGERPDWETYRQRGWFSSGALVAKDEDGGSAWWWLRSPGNDPAYAANVYADGRLLAFGIGVSVSGGVRPAFWLNLES